MRGADLVVRALEEEGVRFTFGIPGTHNIELYDALERSELIRPILVTDEQSASFMADAVSRCSGSVGVVNVVPGAGVTHCLSGVAEAWMDNVPMVVLTCGIRNDTGRAYQLHDVDQLAILRPVTKAQIAVEHPADLYPSVRRAFAIARGGCPGPVAVEVPANHYMLTQEVARIAYEPEAPLDDRPRPEALESALELIRQSARPVLYAGNGARGAAPELLALALRLGAPVATTIQGKGVFPESHPLWLWNGLGTSAPPFVRRVMERCDLLIAVGCRFGEVATASYGFEQPARMIHADIDGAVLGRNYRADVALRCDAKALLTALLERLPEYEPSSELLAAIGRGHREVLGEWRSDCTGSRVAPAALFGSLQRFCSPETVYVTDSGNGTFLAMEHLRLEAPGRFLAPVDYSCMGYAVPAAIGARLARSEGDVVALAGDGALLMTGLELLTAASYGAAPLVCVLRDGELGQIAQFQRTALNRDTCSILPDYDTEDLARTTGCAFWRVAQAEQLETALPAALETTRSGRPAVVEVAIDYSRKTFFTRGVVTTNFWRLPWPDRLRLLGRAAGRRLRANRGR